MATRRPRAFAAAGGTQHGELVNREVAILVAEALAVYLLVLWAHSLRRRFGLAHFYALIGGLTAIMSWVTDAGVVVQAGGLTFVVGSTVFYTSLLLGVFVVYVFDGPRATRVAISTVAGVSALVPLIAAVLHLQMDLADTGALRLVPTPSLRINTASVIATVADLLFLAMVWEYLGRPKRPVGLWLRAFITLLGVMWLDVLLFGTGAFLGTPAYTSIITGTFLSRLVVAAVAWPVLFAYLHWQTQQAGQEIEQRPVLAIVREVAHVRAELDQAQREIKRRKKAEREQEILLETIPVPVFCLDCRGRYRSCNRAFERLVGTARAEIIGKMADQISPHLLADAYQAMDKELLAHPGRHAYEGQVRTAAGKYRSVFFSRATLLDTDGRIDGLVGVILDITERKQAEDALRQQQRLAAVGTLARGVAHEINNPITGVMNYAQLINDKLPAASPLRSYTEEIIREVTRVATVTRGLLTFARQEADPVAGQVVVATAVSAALAALPALAQDGITVDVALPADLPALSCPPQSLHDVLLALLTNARDALNQRYPAAHPDKRIRVSAEVLRDDALPWLRLTVADHGPGVPEANWARIYEPFFTTKDRTQHAGLGLAISHGLVKQMAGRLTLAADGPGARFHVDLPLPPASAAETVVATALSG